MTGTTHILLVEDNLADAGLVGEGLAAFERPAELHLCRDGEEALAFLRREGAFGEVPRPDLILLDLNIPRKNGREVLAAIKGDADLSTIPVVVLSTSAAEADIEDCYRLHANAYVVKPLALDDFIEAMQAIEHFWLGCAALHGPPGRAEALQKKRHAQKPARGSATAPASGRPPAPAPAPAKQSAEPGSAPAGTNGAGAPDGHAPDVIIVEDDRAAAEMLEYAMTNAGYTVMSFMDGSAALSALLDLPVGDRSPVVLLDVDLPGTDGFKILREITTARPGVFQVILCTMHKSEASQVLGFKSGAADYVVKPFRFPVVMAKVRRLLNG